MSAAEKVVDTATFRRFVEREKNRTTYIPTIASREAARLTQDDIIDAAFFLRRNGRPFRFDAKRYGHDCYRLFGPVEGLDLYIELRNAAGYSDDDETDDEAEWLSFNRERLDTDLYIIDLCEKVYSRRDELIDPDENPHAGPLQLSAVLVAELDRLTDEAEQFRANEIADEEAERKARIAESDAEDKAEHAKMIDSGEIISLADYRMMLWNKSRPKPPELGMRRLQAAEEVLTNAKLEAEQATARLRNAATSDNTASLVADLNAAIAKRNAAKGNVDAHVRAVRFLQEREKQFDDMKDKVEACADSIKGKILADEAASRPQFVPPSNAGPIPVPSNTVRTPMIGNGGAAVTPSDYIAFDSDEALASQFVSRYADNLRYVATWGRWLEWDGQRWRFDDTLHAFDLARRICREIASSYEIKVGKAIASAKTIAAVERMAKTDRNIAAVADQWDCDLWLLNTPGGVVDLRTGEIRAARPDDYMTKSTAVAPGGECPTFLAFLERVTGGDNELAKFLQTVLGYSLTGETREHALFFCYGTGANGKSVLLSTITGILASYHVTAPIATFTESATERHPTDLAGLQGARLVTAIETEENRRWAENKIKSLTGGDKISARRMRQDFFEFTPIFKLMIAGNHKPGLRSVDEAIRRRFHLIPFGVTIPKAERDPDLANKLKAEWPGILAWMIEGCRIWQRDGLQVPNAVMAATAAYLEAEDAIAAWLDERCERDTNAWTSRDHLFASWTAWASAAGEFGGSSRRFQSALAARGFEDARQDNKRGFRGLKLRPMFGTMPLPPTPRQ